MYENFKVIDFRFADRNDIYDITYADAWSRVYEYAYVIDFIKSNKLNICKIHNTAWGNSGVHILFRDKLDNLGDCIHSDIIESNIRKTQSYDITSENNNFKNKFDIVINVSTIEHLKTESQRILAIQNLFKQVKKNGYLILTFDYPRVNLTEIETLVNRKCKKTKNVLNGKNSIIQNTRYSNLNIIYLILQKI